MEPVHLLALSNILHRPILLLDQSARIELGNIHLNRGLIVPLRRTREEVQAFHHGRQPGALAIGWQSGDRIHYVSIGKLEPDKTFLKWWVSKVLTKSPSPNTNVTPYLSPKFALIPTLTLTLTFNLNPAYR